MGEAHSAWDDLEKHLAKVYGLTGSFEVLDQVPKRVLDDTAVMLHPEIPDRPEVPAALQPVEQLQREILALPNAAGQ